MTNSRAASIIRAMLADITYNELDSEQIAALDHACIVMAETEDVPRTGIEEYSQGKYARTCIRQRRPLTGVPWYETITV